MEVSAALLRRAIGEAAFAALTRELGAADVYHMTEQQAEAVVRLQLGQLAALERDEILKEYAGLRTQITEYERLLSDERNITDVIRADLEELGTKYGDQRKTQIDPNAEAEVSLEDLIPEEDVVVSLSHGGYIKRMPIATFRTQHRGGKGVQGGAREEDF